MTWWDHETESVWSQPWGTAISGPLQGTRLEMVPANIVPWSVWVAAHPQSQVLDVERYGFAGQQFMGKFVIGITLGEDAKAYPFGPASIKGVINDRIGPIPVVVLADAATKAIHAYVRKVLDDELNFTLKDGNLVDDRTGSIWDSATGIGLEGPLKEQTLRQVPYMTSFDWAWRDFYPHSQFYQ